MSVPAQKDIARADARPFNALRDLENSLMAYELELPSSGPYGERHPDLSRLYQILGVYALTLREIETELDPDLSAPDLVNRCWGGIASACATVPTALYQVRNLREASTFQEYIWKALGPDYENAAERDGVDPGGEKPPLLNVTLIEAWIEVEGWINKTLAQKLKISERAVSSIRNNGNYHGADAVTKLANLMGRDPEDLYLPPEAST
jgi:transcriptional regulator with XRE-family HTH domain